MDEGESRTYQLLMGTAKVVGTIAVLSLFAGTYLAERPDIAIAARDRAAVAALSSGKDPMVTGSLRQQAQVTRIDPCAAPAR